METVLLKMENIHKQFPGVYALCQASLELRAGEVHALLGENGAGKSTLMKILAGIYPMDEGAIYIKGEKVSITSVQSSHAQGIGIIHQELCLVPNMTVADNIFLGREMGKGETVFVNDARIKAEAQRFLDLLGLDIKATDKVHRLSIAQQQMVEIAKALSINADILVMDEPTASLTDKEVAMLFKTIANLKKQQIGIIYISHRMEELFAIADRVTVMRDGRYIGTQITAQTTRDQLISMMVGRELKDLYARTDRRRGAVVLEVKNLKRGQVLTGVSFSVHKGEIVGIAGLVGAGRTETARAIFGVERYDSGTILIDGREVCIRSPLEAMDNGIALVPESRKEQGLVLGRSVGFNITITVLKQFMKLIHIDRTKEAAIIQDYIRKLSIRTPSAQQTAGNLSGGNQQKIVIAKWLATAPKVLILDEPTRGVDVGAKAEIYAIMNMLAQQGVAIIMISSELPEVIHMSDRLLVMHKGQIRACLNSDEFDQEKIMRYAIGG